MPLAAWHQRRYAGASASFHKWNLDFLGLLRRSNTPSSIGEVMAIKKFISEDSKKKCSEIVKDIESKTSAEIVISVQGASDDYIDTADYAAVFSVILASILILSIDVLQVLEMPPVSIVVVMLFFMTIGKIAGLKFIPLKRLLTPVYRQATMVLYRAQAKFFELGISRTSGRNGILFYVSLFEQRVAVLPDIGINESVLGEPWSKMKEELNAAVAKSDFDAFETAMKKAGPILGAAMPRAEDDINELPDDIQS